MGVVVGMAHNLMPRLVEGLHRLRVFVHPLPHHKEGGLHLVFAQDVNEGLGVLVAPGRIKGQGHHRIVRLDTVHRQLSGGGRGSHHLGVADQAQDGHRRQHQTHPRQNAAA